MTNQGCCTTLKNLIENGWFSPRMGEIRPPPYFHSKIKENETFGIGQTWDNNIKMKLKVIRFYGVK